jgi:hypothetical protein
MELTKELYKFIEGECNKFEANTNYDVDVNDVLYSFLYSTDENFYILNDWDEGRNNDPYWNEELNEHSVIVFLKKICKEITNHGKQG